MKKTLVEYAQRYGNKEAAERIGVSQVTVWRWLKEEKEVTIELYEGKPMAIVIRTPLVRVVTH